MGASLLALAKYIYYYCYYYCYLLKVELLLFNNPTVHNSYNIE